MLITHKHWPLFHDATAVNNLPLAGQHTQCSFTSDNNCLHVISLSTVHNSKIKLILHVQGAIKKMDNLSHIPINISLMSRFWYLSRAFQFCPIKSTPQILPNNIFSTKKSNDLDFFGCIESWVWKYYLDCRVAFRAKIFFKCDLWRSLQVYKYLHFIYDVLFCCVVIQLFQLRHHSEKPQCLNIWKKLYI